MTSGSDFLYPFIESDERDAETLLDDLAASARAKAAQSRQLLEDTLARLGPELDATVGAMAERFAAGGRLFTFGNGGSSTDARSVATLFGRPSTGRGLPARSLADDLSVITALGNDVGFELVFSRQLIAHARAGDIAFGLSTSGNSTNVITAFAEAAKRGLLTVGLAGYDGGQMAACDDLAHCLVVRADSIHRIQEVQAALGHQLWLGVQSALATVPA